MIHRLRVPDRSPRISWNEYFLGIAEAVALRSSCPRLQVGCVIVRDQRILATGYNGAASHAPHCIDVGCLMVDGHCTRAIHAEENAIRQTVPTGVNLAESTLYCTHKPCEACRSLLRDNGIFDVRYRQFH